MAYELDQTPRPKALGPHAIAATRREGRVASTREEPHQTPSWGPVVINHVFLYQTTHTRCVIN